MSTPILSEEDQERLLNQVTLHAMIEAGVDYRIFTDFEKFLETHPQYKSYKAWSEYENQKSPNHAYNRAMSIL